MNLSSLFSVFLVTLAVGAAPQLASADSSSPSGADSIEHDIGSSNADALKTIPFHPTDYFVKLFYPEYQGKCLTFDPYDDHYAKFIDCSTKASVNQYQQWYYDPAYGYIKSYHQQYRDWCLTLDDPHRPRNSHRVGYLRLSRCHGGVNQRWYYNEYHDYRFRSGLGLHYCMDWCRDCGNYIHTRECDDVHDKDQEYSVGDKFFF